ncbi:short-chain dehydrogenase TIC 32, chloroplastic [Selaginella moellendorffii]|uniref:short-chain dehydrogenase TIC 32, chloroplastic n=1 Tax=Selaginella moellendorffii TaxID=88036 RepID=UPI000D1C881A|nr:short-chain dehydrogenase TIC 32, chloroplastic [Selaginella moellendorffii]|eukprot:XP_024542096.1 short-chain dehydrogenase TIC 32, chloroplastic [Selaginella moellendorffii]
MDFLRYLFGCKGQSGYGSSTTAEQVADGISLSSYTAIVTGATSGIGVETARVLAKQGACVVIPVRKLQSGEEVRCKILQEFPDANVAILELDLSSLKSVRKFVANFKALKLPLNILINNAGIAAGKFVLSEDGLELDFATNYMGHFLLVELLIEDMIKTARESGKEGRIVIVSSEAHRFTPTGGIALDKINDKKSFWYATSYGQSKLANLLHCKELSKRLQEMGDVNVTVNALHPGSISTGIGRDFNALFTRTIFALGSPFLKNVSQGAATTVYAAVHPSLKGISGKYLMDCNEADCHANAKDMKLANKLWAFSMTFLSSLS